MIGGSSDRVVYAHGKGANCTYETAMWSNVVFYCVTFDNVTFNSCKFNSCSFVNCEFNICDILDCTFFNCSFVDSYVSHAMAHTTFDNCSFVNCEIETVAAHVSFGTSRFAQCHMEKCGFDGVDISRAVMYLCDMPDGATIVSDVTIHDGGAKAGKRNRSRRDDVFLVW